MIFLHGGGDQAAWRDVTFGRFLAAADEPVRLALVMVDETIENAQSHATDYLNIFNQLSNPPAETVILPTSPSQPVTHEQLDASQPTAVFICGGLTPLYHEVLCSNSDWLRYLIDNDIPYGGTSAGAAIAAQSAILGGWLATRNGKTRDVLFLGASEGLDALTVKSGLGLVSFGVDVHASQMGTLTRLIHAVELGLVNEGWAIDENTALIVQDDVVEVVGAGHAYHVQWQSNAVSLAIHTAVS